jgi:hypothetical protein
MAPKLSATEATCEAFFNQTHIIFGRELLPFCLRHWILLTALKSPLIFGGPVELHDMRLAVIACSTKSDSEFMEACNFASDEWAMWKQVTSLMPPKVGLAAFNRYVEDYLPQFPFWKNDKASDDSKLDGFLVTAASLLDSCTPDYIENMPLGKMLVWAMAKNEAAGYPNKNLMSDFEVETLRSNPAFAEAV